MAVTLEQVRQEIRMRRQEPVDVEQAKENLRHATEDLGMLSILPASSKYVLPAAVAGAIVLITMPRVRKGVINALLAITKVSQ